MSEKLEARTQFTFYESFFKAISRIKDEADRCEAYDAICAYALHGEEPDMEKLSDAAAIAFELAKPNLDASRKKALGGRRGGAKSKDAASIPQACGKDAASIPQASPKHTASKKEGEKEKEREIENECYISPAPKKTRHKYGHYSNVLLSDEELDKLKIEFPTDWEQRIERLSEYIASKGVKYKDHLATIRSWARKDGTQGQTRQAQPKSGGDRLLEMIRGGVFDE